MTTQDGSGTQTVQSTRTRLSFVVLSLYVPFACASDREPSEVAKFVYSNRGFSIEVSLQATSCVVDGMYGRTASKRDFPPDGGLFKRLAQIEAADRNNPCLEVIEKPGCTGGSAEHVVVFGSDGSRKVRSSYRCGGGQHYGNHCGIYIGRIRKAMHELQCK